MREVNEMYLRLNTLRDGFGIGPLIKNHSEGEEMQRDRVRSKIHSALCRYSGSRDSSESVYRLLKSTSVVFNFIFFFSLMVAY